MAGIIEFKNGDWDVSSGGFRAMAEGVAQHLSASRAGVEVRNALALAVNSELYFLDVAGGFDMEMIKEFERALASHFDKSKATDAGQMDNPELHQGYLSRLAELQERLSQAIKVLE